MNANREPARRALKTVRLSITTECGLDCVYCNGDGSAVRMDRPLAASIARASWLAGARLLRLTGGDPLSHPDVVGIVADAAGAPGAGAVALTTSGRRLSELARPLKAAGLRRVNIGLSSLEVDTYRRIACADIEPALAGLDAAIEAGLDPVKINIVLVRGINDGEIASFVALARTRPVEVRFIERMPFGGADSTVPSAEVRQRIEAEARIALGEARVTPTALVYRPAGFAGSVGTISPLSDPFCGRCDRLRVTSAGVARACLAEQHGIDIAGAARAGATDQELARLLLDAFECKPAGHRGRFDGLMRSVGG